MLQQTYHGYFEQGQFISPDKVTIPDRMPVTVTLELDKVPSMVNTSADHSDETIKRRLEWWDNLFASMDMTDGDEITDDDIEWLNTHRVNFNRELDL